jgi:hypothetical protein
MASLLCQRGLLPIVDANYSIVSKERLDVYQIKAQIKAGALVPGGRFNTCSQLPGGFFAHKHHVCVFNAPFVRLSDDSISKYNETRL